MTDAVPEAGARASTDALILRCREVHDVAARAASTLRPVLEPVSKDKVVYTFKDRLKPAMAILSKVNRKREDDGRQAGEVDEGGGGALKDRETPYGPDNVTDAWGCRYVTLYQSQIPPTIEAVVEAFERFNLEALHKIELLEFVIYTNRPESDPLSIVKETMAFIASCGLLAASAAPKVKTPENRKSAYSSVHIVCSLPVMIDLKGSGESLEQSKFEIQVRDIFEEGWGEIQHDLIYSAKDRTVEDGDDAGFAPLWRPHLNALKTFVDGCSQHASIIKQTYDAIHLRKMPSLDTRSPSSRPDDRSAILEVLQGKASGEAITAITAAYDLIIEAQTHGA